MKVLAFGDTHFPFENKKSLLSLYRYIAKSNPDVIIHLGDLYDNYMFSRFDKDFNVIKPKDELLQSNKRAIEMWKKIQDLAPNAEKCQLFGNHDIRISKLIMSRTPTLASEIKTIREKYYTFPGVKVMTSDREYVEYDNVIYVHGWHNSNVMHMRHFKKPVVHGHNHRPDMVWEPASKTEYKPRWEVDCGCLADQTKVPFDYTNSIQTSWKAALAIIDNGLPNLIIL